MQTFKDADFQKEIFRAITDMGFEVPTPIQKKTIPHLLSSDEDIIALAQTGTGKTAAFGLPIIEMIEPDDNYPQAIVLCPTRELCIQIAKDFESFTKYLPNIHVTAIYGGASIDPQIKALRRGTHIVVGTPGRVNDVLRRNALQIDKIRWLVLDEADEMLNMGFKDELDSILEMAPKKRQTLLFSATMPSDIQSIANNYMNNPVELTAGKKNAGAENVSHFYYVVQAKNRYLALKRIADINPNIYGIVFCRTRQETKDIANSLIEDSYSADALHGDLSQAQREQVMHRFRQKHIQLLVATDVAARGIDVSDISHIINYNLPDENEIYLHRSGRTGRAGKTGISISIIHTRETSRVRQIEKILDKKMVQLPVPNGKESCEKQLFNVIDKIETIKVDEASIAPFLPDIYSKLEWLDRDQLIKHVVSVEFSRFLEYYKNAPDLNASAKDADFRSSSAEGDGMFQKYFINIGARDNLTKVTFLDLFNKKAKLKEVKVGKVEILQNFSFFMADRRYEKQLLEAFRSLEFNGAKIVVEPKTNSASTSGSGRRGSSSGYDRRGSSLGSDRKGPASGYERRTSSSGSDRRGSSSGSERKGSGYDRDKKSDRGGYSSRRPR